jgi:hypothetical protein
MRLLIVGGLMALATALAAQQPASTAVSGVVVDAVTGVPVPNALVSAGAEGPRALTDSIGRFRVAEVPRGTRQLVVERFGYVSLTYPLAGPAGSALVLRLTPNPIALDSLTLTGSAEVDLSGLVFDGATGAPLPWASITLSRDVVRDVARDASDAQGVFTLDDIRTGDYFLRADRLGYVSQYVPTRVSAPPEAAEIRLLPDSAALAGLAATEQRIRSRSLANGRSVQTFGESLLLRSNAGGMRRFLEDDALLNLLPCEGARARNDCISKRGGISSLRVFIDELYATAGLDQLDSYQPHELHKVEVIDCGPMTVVRAYTYQFMERAIRRQRALLPPCSIPPLP